MSGQRDRLVAVCIATRDRPRGLASLLSSLDAIIVPDRAAVRVVIVDNAQAARVDQAIEDEVGFEVTLLREPRPGIPFARNLAVRHALEQDATDIVFVDDDEVVTPGWLLALTDTVDRTDSDVAVGPVLPDLPVGTPGWLRNSGAFDRPTHADGARIDYAVTNNVLVRREVFERVHPWFDRRFAVTGGSDWEFFRRVIDHGFEVRWSADAVVHERVPKSRARASWTFRRAFRGGTNHGYIVRTHHGVMSWRTARQIAVAVGRCVLGGLGIPLGVIDRALGVRAVRKFLLGIGTITGFTFGYRIREYNVIHGD